MNVSIQQRKYVGTLCKHTVFLCQREGYKNTNST